MSVNYFPAIWLGEFRSKADYDANALKLADAFSTLDWIDDRVLYSRHPFVMKAYCSACENVTQMRIDWFFAWSDNAASINPAWTETAVCQECGLNSRQRALIDFL